MYYRKTLLDRFLETGLSGQLSVVVFLVGIVLAVFIHVRKSGPGLRLAMVPYSFLPLVMGICGLGTGAIEAIRGYRRASVAGPDEPVVMMHFEEIFQVIPLTALETMVLLVISVVLLARMEIRPVGKNAGLLGGQ